MVRQLTNFHPGVEKSLKDKKSFIRLSMEDREESTSTHNTTNKTAKTTKVLCFYWDSLLLHCWYAENEASYKPTTDTRPLYRINLLFDLLICFCFYCWFKAIVFSTYPQLLTTSFVKFDTSKKTEQRQVKNALSQLA